jgi:hypothetical protein
MRLKNFITVLVSIGLLMSPLYANSDSGKAKPLPSGLQKKLDKGQSLPPGWQKKLIVGERLDSSIYQQGDVVVPLDSKGLLTISLEGKLVRLVKATQEIVEILE